MGCGSGLNLFSNIAMDGSNGIYRYFNMLLIIGISLFCKIKEKMTRKGLH
jgi:hypothetical protein